MLWALLISLLIFGIAYALGEGIGYWFEDQNSFFLLIAGFLVVYIIAAILVSHWIPTLGGQSDLGAFFTILSKPSGSL